MKSPDFIDEIGAFDFVHKCAMVFLGSFSDSPYFCVKTNKVSDMKKLLTVMMVLLMSTANLIAEDHQQHVNLEWGETPPIIDKHKDRSLQTGMEVFLDIPNLVFCSNMTEEQEANIHILNACGEKVMSETLRLSPYSETPLYIGDLPCGTYQLVIELEDAVLSGTFLIFN